MSYSINDLQYIGPEATAKLKKFGIRTTAKLLEAALFASSGAVEIKLSK